jgi:hypothetical protein
MVPSTGHPLHSTAEAFETPTTMQHDSSQTTVDEAGRPEEHAPPAASAARQPVETSANPAPEPDEALLLSIFGFC